MSSGDRQKKIGDKTHQRHQIAYKKCSHSGLFMVVLNVNINYMHRLIIGRCCRFHVFNNLQIAFDKYIFILIGNCLRQKLTLILGHTLVPRQW